MTRLESFLGRTLPKDALLIAWFGFSADPPTIAHRKIVQSALKKNDVVIVFPAGRLAYKTFKAKDWQRIEMVELWKQASNFDESVIISHFDIERKTGAFPWITLWKKIHALAPNLEHSLVVGSDQYDEIRASWKEGKRLLQEARFMVVPRRDNTSSSAARQGDFTHVDEKVRTYILEHHLYR